MYGLITNKGTPQTIGGGLEVRNFAREGNLWAFYSITTYDTTANASIKRKFEIEFAVCFTPSYLFLNIDFQMPLVMYGGRYLNICKPDMDSRISSDIRWIR